MGDVRRIFRPLGVVLVLLGMVLAIAWFAGVFRDKLPPGRVAFAAEKAGRAKTLVVKTVTVPVYETAVGSVRALHETAVGSRLLARVVKVHVDAGMRVRKGQVLVELDDQDIRAKVAQAEQAVKAAQAQAEQARLEVERSKGLHQKKLISDNDWDRIRHQAQAAEAELERAKHALQEARTMLSYAKVRAPISGVVVDKQVDVGDMVTPGQVLVTLYDPTRMQLWAEVRESLAMGLRPGDKVKVKVAVVEGLCNGVVQEVVPASEVASRTFLVKVSGPCPPGVYKGMYGKILLPMGEKEEIHIPLSAVGRVGQLTMVKVVDGKGFVHRRFVRLGPETEDGESVVVLSGLRPGEKILEEFGRGAVGTGD